MTKSQISKHLSGIPSWSNNRNKRARDLFVKDMADRQYGYEPCRDAWLWYIHGWADAMNVGVPTDE